MAASHHPSTINVWGRKGCELPSGGRCTACCLAWAIDEKDFKKDAGDDCDHRQARKGCDLHTSRQQPTTCRVGHCEGFIRQLGSAPQAANALRFVISCAESLGEVNQAQANEARHRLSLE